MGRYFLSLAVIAGLVTGLNAQEQQEKLGLTLGVDYYSTYLCNGEDHFEGHGAFAPYVAYDIAGSGVIASLQGELAYYQGSEESYNNQGMALGFEYEHTFADFVILGINSWYSYYPNNNDESHLIAGIVLGLDVLFRPELSYCHEFLFFQNDYENFYLSLSVGHEFELNESVYLDLGLSAGMYNVDDELRYLNDITASVTLGVTFSGIDIYGSFNALYVPHEDKLFKTFFNAGVSYEL